MTRSKWKGPYVNKKFLNSFQKANLTDSNIIKTFSRSSTVLKKFVGINFFIYNGRNYSKITIAEKMIGHKLGEFSPTRKTFSFGKKKKKKKKVT